jgi:hypothetical protein
MTVHHEPRAAFPILTCEPIGSVSPQIALAVDCETRMTRCAPAVSASVNARPDSTGMPITVK